MRFVVVAVIGTPIGASAGPASYGWLPATELVSAGKVELGGTIYERSDRGDTHERATVLGGAPTFGVTDNFELRIPFELTWRTAIGTAPAFGFTRYGAEGRYRFTARDSELAPVLRFGLFRDVLVRTMGRAELGAALSFQRGPIHVEASADVVAEVNVGLRHFEIHSGVGASVRVYDGLRVGAELYAEASLDNITSTWIAIGPNLAWRLGPSWLSGAFGIGVEGIGFAPRLNWGLAW